MSLTPYATTALSFYESGGFGGAYSASDPTLLFDGTTYRMFYTDGLNDGQVVRPMIAQSISPDGRTWTQIGGNATSGLVVAGPGGDQANLEGACIFKVGDIYVLLYSGYADVGFPLNQFPAKLYAAVSTDGITFVPVSDEPVLAPVNAMAEPPRVVATWNVPAP